MGGQKTPIIELATNRIPASCNQVFLADNHTPRPKAIPSSECTTAKDTQSDLTGEPIAESSLTVWEAELYPSYLMSHRIFITT
ncbi:hypothetical protein OI18_19925 [Flavihumibacter solisilvae]|uniref:Uncharacterized protein n=1 Tax=Flavihumibacter solisilvae TaxID=1349421 RepID=A0A0C1IFW3_9BACT|nr:hypothetical protein OI18_19925 [Flavihumibacter solisilvae]